MKFKNLKKILRKTKKIVFKCLSLTEINSKRSQRLEDLLRIEKCHFICIEKLNQL